MPWVFGLVLKWHDNSELSPVGDASVIPWPNKISELDREFPSRSLRKGPYRGKAKNAYTERKTEECFQRETVGSCSRRDACSFYTGLPRETVRTTWNELEMRKKFSSRSKHPLDGKSLKSPKASPVTKAENSSSMVGNMKNIVVWLSTSSRVSWLPVWKHLHSWLSLPFSTSWW